jgi:hypothetical protein
MKRFIMGSLAALTAVGIAWGSGNMNDEQRNFKGIDRIEASLNLASIEVRAAKTGEVAMDIIDMPDAIEVITDQSGGKLRIEVKKPLVFIPFAFRGKILLTVPETVDLDLSSASGSIYVDGPKGPKVKAESASGSIKIEDGDSVFDLQTASGSIELKHSNGGKIAKSASGSVRIESSKGDIAVKTASGSIRIQDVEATIKAESASGSVKIEDFRGRINASTSSGSISGDGVFLVGDSIFGSTSGSVKVDLSNSEGDLRFDIGTVSGSISAFSARGGRSISTGSGGILVTAKTVSGSVKFE